MGRWKSRRFSWLQKANNKRSVRLLKFVYEEKLLKKKYLFSLSKKQAYAIIFHYLKQYKLLRV